MGGRGFGERGNRVEAGWAGGETGRKWPFKGLTLAKESRPRRWEKGQERCLHTEAEALPAAARVWGLRSAGRQRWQPR